VGPENRDIFGPKKVDLDLDAAKEPEMEFVDINFFNKRFDSFAPCSSQSLLLADFKETIPVLCSGFNNPYKKLLETRELESIPE